MSHYVSWHYITFYNMISLSISCKLHYLMYITLHHSILHYIIVYCTISNHAFNILQQHIKFYNSILQYIIVYYTIWNHSLLPYIKSYLLQVIVWFAEKKWRLERRSFLVVTCSIWIVSECGCSISNRVRYAGNQIESSCIKSNWLESN